MKLNQFTKKYRFEIILAFAIFVIFCFSRLYNLRLWPIFTDEAIYIRWSQIGLNDASYRFIPLTDGKQPLWHWFTMLSMKLVSDPLIAGRLVSSFSGLGALIGIWMLAFELFRKRSIAFTATIFYLFTPFTLFYDRIALVDTMLSMWIIWGMYFGIRTAKTLRLDYAMFAGFSIGAALLTKSPAVFLQYLYPLNLLFLSKKRKMITWLLLIFPTMFIAEGMKNVMRLSPWMHMIGRKNLEFIVSFDEFFQEPFRWFWGNLPSLWKWWVGWLTWPIMLTAIVGFGLVLLNKNHPFSLRSKWRELSLLFVFAVFPFLVAAAFGKVIFARYLLLLTPSILIVAAAATEKLIAVIKQTETKVIFFLFIFVAAIYLDYKILSDPIGAPIIDADRDQYVDGFPAGWGVDDVIEFLRLQTEDKKIFLGTQGTFGLMPYSFEIYLWENPNIEIRGYWPVSEVPEEVIEISSEKPTYFIYYESLEEQIPAQQNLELIEKYQKGKSERYMYFYRVHPRIIE